MEETKIKFHPLLLEINLLINIKIILFYLLYIFSAKSRVGHYTVRSGLDKKPN